MKIIPDHMLSGLLAGILAPVLTFLLYVWMSHTGLTPQDMFGSFYRRHVITHVISLSVIPNLGIFFLFIWKKADHSAKGVLGATILYAILVLILKVIL